MLTGHEPDLGFQIFEVIHQRICFERFQGLVWGHDRINKTGCLYRDMALTYRHCGAARFQQAQSSRERYSLGQYILIVRAMDHGTLRA